MAVVRLDLNLIFDWASFHSVCKEAFGFPEFYGENMAAFVDCLSYIDEGDGMSRIVLETHEDLRIEVLGSVDFAKRNADMLEAFEDSVRSVNDRFLDRGTRERLVIKYI